MLLSLERFNVQRQLGSSLSIVECERKKRNGCQNLIYNINKCENINGPRWVLDCPFLDCICSRDLLNISTTYVFTIILSVLSLRSVVGQRWKSVSHITWVICFDCTGHLFPIIPSSCAVYFLYSLFQSGMIKAKVVVPSTF